MADEIKVDAAEPLFVVRDGRLDDLVFLPALANLLIDEDHHRIDGPVGLVAAEHPIGPGGGECDLSADLAVLSPEFLSASFLSLALSAGLSQSWPSVDLSPAGPAAVARAGADRGTASATRTGKTSEEIVIAIGQIDRPERNLRVGMNAGSTRWSR